MTKLANIIRYPTLSVNVAPPHRHTLTDKVAACRLIATFAHMAAERDDKGKFVKGRKKTGGMQKGYEAPLKKEFRELMADFSRENYDKFVYAMTQCEPKDFCRYYLEALKFNLPMLQSVTLENTKGIANALTDRLRSLAVGKEE